MIRILGLDIGTTTVSAVAVKAENGQILSAVNRPNDSAIPGAPWQALQDPERIFETVARLRREMTEAHGRFDAIGVTGQMHGILYLDRDYRPISPLYTWQDGGGGLPYRDSTYAEYLRDRTGFRLASGYGLVTDFVNRSRGEAPREAALLCTVADWVAAALCGGRPLMHSSNAASLGCFAVERGTFDRRALQTLGTESGLLPEVTDRFTVVGKDADGVPVAGAIGDNQASVIGSVRDENAVLVNIGTGSQVSALTDACAAGDGIEVRPFAPGRRLLVGAPLCGGRAYALLKRFFGECAAVFGGSQENLYAAMDRMAEEVPDERTLRVDTRFCGTRENPLLRGAVTDIGLDNFTPQQLTRGFLQGMAQELYDLYAGMKPYLSNGITQLVGSGNAIRKSRVLQRYLSELFGLPVAVPRHEEEAAFGAAVTAAVALGVYPDPAAAQSAMIQYL